MGDVASTIQALGDKLYMQRSIYNTSNLRTGGNLRIAESGGNFIQLNPKTAPISASFVKVQNKDHTLAGKNDIIILNYIDITGAVLIGTQERLIYFILKDAD